MEQTSIKLKQLSQEIINKINEIGKSIYNIEKYKTENLIDTYRITFTDETYFDFSITNGKDGVGTIESISVNGQIIEPNILKNVNITIPSTLPASDVFPWAKQPNKPTYTAEEVGADTKGSAANAILYTDARIQDLIGTSPENLDTIYELAQAILDNEDILDAINESITNKVDKETGKGLSSNDLTNEMIQRWDNKSDFSGSYNDLTDIPEAGTGSNVSRDDIKDIITDIIDERITELPSKGEIEQLVISLVPKSNVYSESPIGDIIAYMGIEAPKNYLICDGTEYNIEDYPELVSHFLKEFGSRNYFGGNGTTTFAVPDLRGEFLRGADDINSIVGQHQDATEIPYSLVYSRNISIYSEKNTTALNIEPNNIDSKKGKTSYVFSSTSTSSGSTSTNPPLYTTRPTNTGVLYCIKYKTEEPKVVYSYDEQLIGRWVDKKPLYQKTIIFGQLPNKTTKYVPHNVKNIDKIWIYDGYTINAKDNYSSVHSASITAVSNNLNAFVNSTNVAISAGADQSNTSAVITIRYTKTTD